MRRSMPLKNHLVFRFRKTFDGDGLETGIIFGRREGINSDRLCRTVGWVRRRALLGTWQNTR
ncbi:MAG: hypothetical protein U1E05_17750, partial [Patescibacteria group bacterium]|nr:hypothetical protein [Patescibacteria group bacterium]